MTFFSREDTLIFNLDSSCSISCNYNNYYLRKLARPTHTVIKFNDINWMEISVNQVKSMLWTRLRNISKN